MEQLQNTIVYVLGFMMTVNVGMHWLTDLMRVLWEKREWMELGTSQTG